MLRNSELQSGYWLRSLKDFIITLLKHPFIWIAIGLNIAAIVSLPDLDYSGIEMSEMLLSAAFELGSYALFVFTGFLIFRRLNAERINRSGLQLPLRTQVEFSEGSAYGFELAVDDPPTLLQGKIREETKLCRKLKRARKKAKKVVDAEKEATDDLIRHYEQELEKLELQVAVLTERYRIPGVEMTVRFRISNPDRYRVARIQNLNIDVDMDTSIWKITCEGFSNLSGDELSLPLSINPGQVLAATCKCEFIPRNDLGHDELKNFLQQKHRTRVPLSISVGCDDTYKGLAVTTRRIDVTYAPLKDRFEAHWAQSKYL